MHFKGTDHALYSLCYEEQVGVVSFSNFWDKDNVDYYSFKISRHF